MDFNRLIKIVGDEPVFETGLLLAGDIDPADARRQLSRWTKAGRLYQLRQGLYALAPPFQKIKPHPFVIANRMVRGSYVSCQSALAYYNLIPEYVPVVTSVTAARPECWETPLGKFDFRHIKPDFLHGYRLTDLGQEQNAFVATPEKALLDLIHLHHGGDSPDYLREQRLQNLDGLNPEKLKEIARYSEDLDFALEKDKERYDFRAYLHAVKSELAREGYVLELKVSDKKIVHNAFIRFPGLLYELGLSPHRNEVLAIKIEVDTNPPA